MAEETVKNLALAACAPCGFEPEAIGLEKLLAEYTALADNGGWPAWEQGKKITAHQSDVRIPILRQILTITGDYAGAPRAATASLRYNNELVAAVKRFQTRHGLNADGALGKSTQNALAVPIEVRITQIKATIERIRNRPQPIESRFVLVNLPAFTLYAVKRGQPTFGMRVIIGEHKNPTPLFDNAITDVIFNPQWHVPERIAKKELTPKLRKDPAYFVNAGFVVTQHGQPVDPLHLIPGSGKFTFRQLAGDENALGKIKFNLHDSDDIYLHATSAPRLFTKDDRALSHGCIRVENPRELAYFTFEDNADWNAKRIDKAYDDRKERWIKVEPTPVHIVYWTALVDSNGVAHFYNDVYGMDETMSAQNAKDSAVLAAQ